MWQKLAYVGIVGVGGSAVIAQANPEAGIVSGLISGSLGVGAILMMMRHTADDKKHIGERDDFVSQPFCTAQHKQVSEQNKLIIRMLRDANKHNYDTQVMKAINEELEEQ